MTITFEDVERVANEYLLPVGLKLLIAAAIFIFGRWISRTLLKALDRVMVRSNMDISLRKFLGDVAYAVLFAIAVIASLDTIGIKTTAVVAVLGAAGLAVGLALQGSLSNFAAGVMLIVLRPYKVTDLVVIGKYTGRVDAIKVFHTVIITSDNREITIPNGQVITAPIENLTILGHRRVDLVISVAQVTDLAKVRDVLATVVAAEKRFMAAPAPTIEIAEITDATVKLQFRPWASCTDYPKVVPDTMENIKVAMDGAGLKYAVSLQVAA
jgi:small conductance mechanosensitive channel